MSDLHFVALILGLLGVGNVVRGHAGSHYGERDAGVVEISVALTIMQCTSGSIVWPILVIAIAPFAIWSFWGFRKRPQEQR